VFLWSYWIFMTPDEVLGGSLGVSWLPDEVVPLRLMHRGGFMVLGYPRQRDCIWAGVLLPDVAFGMEGLAFADLFLVLFGTCDRFARLMNNELVYNF
jgi:hypothetical protein